jgi:hypothetical protein
VKRGRSLSFLVGTISNVLVMEIGWRDVGSGGYILVSCAHSNTSYIMYRVHLTMSGIWTHIFCGDRYWLHSCKSNYHTIMTMRAPSCIGVHICCNHILRNTTQVIIHVRHRVKILFSVISSPITLERQKWKLSKMKGIILSSPVSCW